MWRKLAWAVGPGLIVGAAVAITAAVARARASGASTGDAMMGAQVLLDYGAMPLSLLTRRPVQALLEATCCGVLSSAVEYGHVILNWAIISLLVATLWRALRRATSRIHT